MTHPKVMVGYVSSILSTLFIVSGNQAISVSTLGIPLLNILSPTRIKMT